MSQIQAGRKSSLLTTTQLKRKLNELSKEEIIELLADTCKSNKEAQAFVSVRLQGEKAILELFEDYKEQIRKEFYPTRGLPKLRVATVKQAISDINTLGKGTNWPLELMICFAEIAVQSIHENGDIFEDMGDCFTDVYAEIIQRLNREKTPELYEKYKDHLKAIVNTKGCECWGIHDSLEGSYSMLKWVDHDEEEEEDFPDTISYAAMKKWLNISEVKRNQIINNAWCGKCSSATTLVNFSISLDGSVLFLNGYCNKCNNAALRVIETD